MSLQSFVQMLLREGDCSGLLVVKVCMYEYIYFTVIKYWDVHQFSFSLSLKALRIIPASSLRLILTC